MSDLFTAVGDLAHRLDADLEVLIRILTKDRAGRLLRLDAPSPEREIGHEKQRSDRNFASKSSHKECRRFHFNRQGPFVVKLRFEFIVELPETIVGRMNHARSVVESFLDEDLRDEFLDLESRQSGHL